MAERIKSKDGVRETDEFVGDAKTPSQQGGDGGHLAERVGSRDEEKCAGQADAGVTRVRKGDEIATGADTVSDKEAGDD